MNNKINDWCEVSPVGDLLIRAEKIHPNRVAVVFPNEKTTYQTLLSGAIKMARGLYALGVEPGDKIGVLGLNNIAFIEALFGISLLGCIAIPMNTRHKATELRYIIDHAQITALFTTSDISDYVDFTELLYDALPSLKNADKPQRLQLPEAPHLKRIIIMAGQGKPGFLDTTEFAQVAQNISTDKIDQLRRRVRVRDIATILYTSGTTANPKGCMLSHEAMTRGAVERARGRLSVGDHNITWSAGPLSHIGSLGPFLGTIGVAGTHLVDTYFEPGRALKLMYEEGVTAAWPWFPAIIQSLLDHPDFDPDKLDKLRSMLIIAPSALVEKVQKLLPQAEINQACGMTETAGIFAISSPDDSPLTRTKTQGRASPGIEVKILDCETHQDAPLNTPGELLVRGYCVMEAYYRDPDKTAEALESDGWFHTGDLYSQTADGSLMFNGRVKDMLKVGGENVAAIEIESYLCNHSAVKICEVVGRPDARLDEVPVAFVELRSGYTIQAETLIQFCKGNIANYKVPRAIYFLTEAEWPMSATKVNKNVLRERLNNKSH